MATCKDCFHYEACVDMLQAMGYTVNGAGHLADNRCRVFKDRNFVTFQKWIPVTEKLPEDNTRVLACIASRISVVAYFRNDNWLVSWDQSPCRFVTHWMPLAESPKEEPHE